MNKVVLFSLMFLVLMCLAGIVDAQKRRRLTPEERRQRRLERQARKERRRLAKLRRKEAKKARRAERLKYLNRAKAEEERQRALKAAINDDLRVQAVEEKQEHVDFTNEDFHKERSNIQFSFKKSHDVDKGSKTSFKHRTGSSSKFGFKQDKDLALENFDRKARNQAHETKLDTEREEESQRESLLDAAEAQESLDHQRAANRQN